jgi:hypothetical protein
MPCDGPILRYYDLKKEALRVRERTHGHNKYPHC